MSRWALPLAAAFTAAWFAIAVATLSVVGAARWWFVVERSAAHGHLRFAAACLLLVALPVLLSGALAWCWRRGWVPFVAVAGLAVVTPALVVPRLTHLIPAWGLAALVALELLGITAAYAVTQRALERSQSSTAA